MTDINIATTLANAFGLPATGATQTAVNGEVCALTGCAINEIGVPVSGIATSATADIADTFRYGTSYVHPDAARCFAASNTMRGNLAVVDNVGIRPFISRASATPERPAWVDLIRLLRHHQPAVLIITDEAKRRLWHKAAIGVVSNNGYPVLVNIAGKTELLTIRHQSLLDCLSFVERVYELGFSKAAIGSSLLTNQERKHIQSIGIAVVRSYEEQLRQWRSQPEFRVSLLITQKEAQ